MREQRVDRLNEIIQKLWKLGVRLDAKEVFDIVGKGAAGRLHIAEAIWRNGYTENIYESFKKYIGEDMPAYVPKKNLSTRDAIEMISNVGGIPVIAHPYKIDGNAIIPKLIDEGLQGIEVFYPAQEVVLQSTYRNLAKKHGLVITGGSDFHGTRKPNIQLGAITIPEEFINQLKERAQIGELDL